MTNYILISCSWFLIIISCVPSVHNVVKIDVPIELICEKCSIEIVSNIIQDSTYTESEIQRLFCTIDTVCNNNVEFLELYNAALFVVLKGNKKIFYSEFQNSDKKNLIISELKSPVSDNIDIGILIEEIQAIPEIRDSQILKALIEAQSKI